MPSKKKFIKIAIPDGVDVQEFERSVHIIAADVARALKILAEQQAAECIPKDGLKGFHIEKGVVSLTADRAFADDVKAGRVPDSVVEDARRAGKYNPEPSAPSSEEIQTHNPKYARCINRLR